MITRFIPGPLPGRNEQEAAARTHYHTAAQLKDLWTSHVARIFAGSGQRYNRVKVHFRFLEPNRRRDPDNIIAAMKYILDGIVAADIIKKDGWTQIAGLTFEWEVVERDPGVIVTVTEV